MNAREWSNATSGDDSSIRALLIEPSMIDFMRAGKNRRILDVGCGDASFTQKIFYEFRPEKLVAVDLSEEMAKLSGKAIGNLPGVEIYCENISSFREPQFHFDQIIFFMSLMNIADVESAMYSAKQLLDSAGEINICILHPCFSTEVSGWLKRKTDNKQCYYVSEYLSEKKYTLNWAYKRSPDLSEEEYSLVDVRYQRSLTTYMRIFKENGFCISDLIEPAPTTALIKDHPWLTPYYLHIPICACIKLIHRR